MIKWLLGTPPAIGSVWRFPEDVDNPFAEEVHSVTIIDVQNGYVKYYYRENNWSTNSKRIRDFRAMYRKVKP